MTVAELIKMLSSLPQDYPVRMAYDSMVCIYDVTKETSFLQHHGDYTDPLSGEHYTRRGLYLCAMGKDAVDYHREEEGGEPIS